jgi:hypothetical protein
MDLSVIIVTSPAVSNPDTFLIDTVIESLDLLNGVDMVPILIIADGFLVSDKPQPKKGRITQDMKTSYEHYISNVREKYRESRFSLHASESHIGFALAVKWGLELCRTTFALVLQHDRKFVLPFSHLHLLMECMVAREYMRYIHFPTVMSAKHTSSLRRYGLHHLIDADVLHIPINVQCELRPIIFWYDSTTSVT